MLPPAGHRGLEASTVAPGPAGSQTAVGSGSDLTAGTSFEAAGHEEIANDPCGTPPDPNSDVGPNDIVEIVNCGYAVYDKSGNVLAGPVPTQDIFAGMDGPCAQTNDGDGVVRYDPLADRWLISQFSLANDDGVIDPSTGSVYTQNFQCVAVSKTSDPLGGYWLYTFGYNGFNDYPKIGVWPDAYYVTYNMFTPDEGSFTGAKSCALDRASMLTGAPATQQCVDLSANYVSLLPADLDGATPPPTGAPNYQISLDRNSLSVLDAWDFHVDWQTPANSALTGPTQVPVPAYTPACSGYSRNACIPQAPAPYYQTGTLESLGDRLMFPLQYRNFGEHQTLVVSHAVSVNNVTGERWYELSVNASNAISVAQSGTYAPTDGVYRFMGSTAEDGAGDLALGYSVSNASIHPGIRITGRLSNDPAGQLTQTEQTIVDGQGSEGDDYATVGQVVGRWGDYTSMNVDPANDCTFWYTNEFYPQQTDSSDTHFYRRWRTQIASFRFTQCTSTKPPPPTVTGVSPSSGPTTGGTAITVTGTGFVAGATVAIGQGAGTPAVWATDVNVVSPTEITATTPAATVAGTFETRVRTSGGTSAATRADRFTYTAPRPTVTGVSPSSGPTTGGTAITVTGTGFVAGATVAIGQGSSPPVWATNVSVVSPTEITATTPAATIAGRFHTYVRTSGGQSVGTSADKYTYSAPRPTVTGVSPSSGPTTGGTAITVTGTGFVAGATVAIGQGSSPPVWATNVSVVSPTEITATTPAATIAGRFHTYVRTSGGQSVGTSADIYIYS